MRKHENTFDLLRLAAASMVLWSHQHAVLGIPESGLDRYGLTFGEVGVFMFFAISGYLNTLSVMRHHSLRVFLVSRALRIYPALIVCVVSPSLGIYLDEELLAFIGKNVTLLTGIKAGVSQAVFVGSSIPNAMNGSLWTLPYEVRMYVLLAICFLALRYRTPWAMCAAIGGILIIGFSTFHAMWLQFAALFAAGCFIAVVQKFANLSIASIALVLLSLALVALGREFFAWYFVLAAIVVGVGCLWVPWWLRPSLDLSYAIYLYAFPVQQLSTVVTGNFWLGLTLSAAGTLLLAIASAIYVERPAQRLKILDRLPRRQTAHPAAPVDAAPVGRVPG
jgi:peptidoglycan/LPS O-acetylase OafA/YrhL